MPLSVTFKWLDAYGRETRQTLTTTSTTIADALTDVTAFVALQAAVSDAGLTNVSISEVDNSDAYAAVAGANIDVNASLQVQGADGFKYDLDMHIIKDTKVTGGGAVILSDLDVLAWTNQFLAGGKWRVNNRFPSAITAVLKGQLDK